MTILLTGGAGYIGSHTALELINAGYDVIVVDSYINSSPESIERVKELTGKEIISYFVDVCDKKSLLEVMLKHSIEAVIHFAGMKAVGESVEYPLKYYRNNIDSTLTLLECMKLAGVTNIIFSSSATIYGDYNPVPYNERMPRGRCSNPYGWTKSMIEQIFEDSAKADDNLSVIFLRYTTL